VARPSELWAAGEFGTMTQGLVDDLRVIADLEGPMEFTADADDLVHSWYDELTQRINDHNSGVDPDPWTAYFLARKQAHVHKLAMVFSAARRSDRRIGLDDLQDAIDAVDEVEAEIPRVFKLTMEPTPLARMEREALDRIMGAIQEEPTGLLPRAVAFAKAARFVDSSTANKIIENAVARGAFKQQVTGGQAWLKLP
jgi:hypothetical protein